MKSSKLYKIKCVQFSQCSDNLDVRTLGLKNIVQSFMIHEADHYIHTDWPFVCPYVCPKISKQSDNHCWMGLWAGRVDHWWLLPVLLPRKRQNPFPKKCTHTLPLFWPCFSCSFLLLMSQVRSQLKKNVLLLRRSSTLFFFLWARDFQSKGI